MTTPLPVEVAQAEILWHAAIENCGLGTNELVRSVPLCFKLQMLKCSLTAQKWDKKRHAYLVKFLPNNGSEETLNYE